MRIIMVPVADRPESVSALRTSLQLAAALGANVEAFHIRPHRDSKVSLTADAALSVTSAAAGGAVAASQAARQMVAELAAQTDMKMVKRFSAGGDRQVLWAEQVGHVEKLMPVLGPFADLIVVTRPRRKASHLARAFLRSALLDSSRPVLILPPRGASHLLRHVAVAWDRSHEAMRAVVAAMPLLRHADEVSIIASGEGKPTGPKPKSLQQYLSVWGVKTTVNQTRGARADAVDDIESHVHERRADLLVMGSYSRSRLRERIFGGVTRHVLNEARFPVLTVHR